MRRVFACTTHETVAAFFERQGFEEVAHDELPARKWQRYDQRRLRRVRGFKRELAVRRRRKPSAAD
jgi:N-acetylglutamate synthase-like GNAT family acetyltransferase